MEKIKAAYVHVKKTPESFVIFGIATCKGKDTTWYLFQQEDQLPEKHDWVANKWKSQSREPKTFRNIAIQGEVLDFYLNKEGTEFSFGGVALQKDEQNSIKQSGTGV